MKLKTLFLSLFMLSGILFLFSDEKGEEIGRKAHNLKKADDMSSQSKMILIDSKGNKTTRELKNYSKKFKNGTNSFIEFLSPGDVAGTKFLTIVEANGEETQRIYLPALKKVRRIAAGDKNGKFMNSDITYYDMENREFEDSNYQFIAENKTDDNFKDMKFYVVKVTDKKGNSPYGYSESWVNMDNYFVYRIDVYNKKGNLLKRVMNIEVKDINGVLIPTRMVVDNIEDNHKTLMMIDNPKINSGLPDSIFEINNLQ